MNVSVIIPLYNEEETIEKTIRHLVASIDHSDIPDQQVEIILVDSSDTDKTYDILLLLQKRYEMDITLLRLKDKTFAGKARNIGVSQSKYGIICFIDAGVYADVDWFSKLLICFSNTDGSGRGADNGADIAWGMSGHDPTTAWERSYIRSFHRKGYSKRYIRSSMMKKEVFLSQGGFIEYVHAGEDLDFYKKISKAGYNEVFTDAQAYYSHFPKNTAEVLKKWISFTKDNVMAGRAGKKVVFIIGEIFLFSLAFPVARHIGFAAGMLYLFSLAMIRFLFSFYWSGLGIKEIREIPLTIFLVCVFDFTRFSGVVYGFYCRIYRKIKK